MTEHRQRLHFLDSLRGLAAVYVVFFHTLLVPNPAVELNSRPIYQFIHFGGTGVFLFFVISGFSLAMTMPRHINSGTPYASYVVSRLFRIVPLFFMMVAVYSVFQILRYHQSYSPELIALNISMLFNLVPNHQEGIVMASWTIGVEMLFYVLFPFIWKANTPKLLSYTGISLVMFWLETRLTPWSYYYWSFLGYFSMFIIGMCAFRVFISLQRRAKSPRSGNIIALIGVVILLVLMFVELAEKSIPLRLPIAIGYAMILVGCGLGRPAIMDARIFRFFGKISYSLYLVHAPIILFLTARPEIRSNFQGVPAYLVELLLVLIVATTIATALHYIIEGPGEKLGKQVLRRIAIKQAQS